MSERHESVVPEGRSRTEPLFAGLQLSDTAARTRGRHRQLCSSACPTCGRPCRGFAGHAPPHQCNQHHSW